MDRLDEILQRLAPNPDYVHPDSIAEAHAAIEAYFDAKFERALGEKDTNPTDDSNEYYMATGRNTTIADARARWYSDRQKGEGR